MILSTKGVACMKEALLYKAGTALPSNSVEEVVTHRSKVDWWIATILFTAIFGLSGGGIFLFLNGFSLLGGVLSGLAFGIICFLILKGIPTHYILNDQRLIVRAGLLFQRVIPLGTIRDVLPSKNIDRAPAWSTKRLRINYSRYMISSHIFISPKDPGAFLRDIVARAPQLKLSGDQAVDQSILTLHEE